MKKIIGLNDIARLDLNLATTFLALWEARSVSLAAQHLHLSQSAVSGALARLRAVTGDPLFVRTAKGMEPTPHAAAMAPALHDAITAMQAALSPAMAFDPLHLDRPLVLGMSDDFMLACGPALVRRLQREAPKASLLFRQCNRQTAAAMLQSREIDLAMVAGGAGASLRGMASQIIGQSSYLCLGEQELFARFPEWTLEDYVGVPHVLVSYTGRSGMVDDALRNLGRTRTVVTALTQFAALPAFLQGSGWIATLPGHAARALARISGLMTAPPPMAVETYDVILAWRRELEEDPASQWLRALVAQVWKGEAGRTS
ncbi:LysR family transcriptional regulator [Novosphingobium umbonatum]|uniref:LysR family transcriptional regulator n=1 Tax=Novosphingobium umbonatum TaxID=1908524 RepID=A0A3S2UUX0_9SPHN|nr:LysR family transcriptional regulator [Novosphingobium umbonatum]RVU05672.1 LysR family transcriptional regulator [Novosphingobium umbonatum]